MSPGEYKSGGAGLELVYGFHPSPFGHALAVVAPRGLPADIRTKLHAALVGILQSDAVKDKLVAQGFEIVANTPEQFAQYQASEFARWKKVIEVGKITAD